MKRLFTAAALAAFSFPAAAQQSRGTEPGNIPGHAPTTTTTSTPFGSTTVQGVMFNQATVATLPTCNASTKGIGTYYVTDATTPTYNGALTGGGAVAVKVFCNGTSWTSQ
jgi:hypothetical protein